MKRFDLSRQWQLRFGMAVLLGAVVCLISVAPVIASERNAYRVKSAFREVIAGPVHSTVRILCDGDRVALGTIVAADGLILTKASELKGQIICHLHDGRRLAAKLAATSEEYDLALLKIDAVDLPVIQWSDSEMPRVGSWLATPGLETVPISVGVVSVAPREIKRRVPALGIVIEDSKQGPRVHEVVDGSGADLAGVKANDLVLQFNGQACKSREMLIDSIREYRPGDQVELQIMRGDKRLTFRAKLGDLAALADVHNHFPEDVSGRLSRRRAGFPVILQHDMVLQPNQCGGPAVDLGGRAIGINIARASRVASYAIPADAVQRLLNRMQSETLVSSMPAE